MNGGVIGNNTMVSITTVGENENDALLCFTDLFQFTDYSTVNDSFNDTGTWYFPNSSAVATSGDMYITRDQGVVRLHRRNNITMPTGQFHCEILDANKTNQKLFVQMTYYYTTMTSRPSSPNKTVVAGASVSGLIILSGFILAIILVTIRYTYLQLLICSCILYHNIMHNMIIIFARLRRLRKSYHETGSSESFEDRKPGDEAGCCEFTQNEDSANSVQERQTQKDGKNIYLETDD